jgi:hypothetical protein
MDRKRNDPFITSVNIKKLLSLSNENTDDPLADVKVEHVKLQGVVNAFGIKVENMIDKQRVEFMDAYDGHMQLIQHDLLILRKYFTYMKYKHNAVVHGN